MNTFLYVMRHVLSVAAVCVITVASIYGTISKVGVHDYIDYNRYVACGVALVDSQAEPPQPIEYMNLPLHSSVSARFSGYPNKLFQITLGVFGAYVSRDFQQSSMVLVSFAAFFITNLLVFFLLKKFMNPVFSLAVVASLSLNSYFVLYYETMVRPLSDPQLMLLAVAGLSLAICHRLGFAALFMSAGFLMRTQAVQILPFIPWCDIKASRKAVLVYFGIIFMVAAGENDLFRLFFDLSSSGSSVSFYGNAFLSNLDLSSVAPALKECLLIFRANRTLDIFWFLIPISIVGVFIRNNIVTTNRLCLLSVSTFVVAFLGWFVMALSPTARGGQVDRYFLYSLCFSTVATALVINSFCPWTIRSTNSKSTKVALLFALFYISYLVAVPFVEFDRKIFHSNLHKYDFCTDFDRSDFSQDAIVGIVDPTQHFQIYSILKCKSVVLPQSVEVFLDGQNNQLVDYLFIPNDFEWFKSHLSWAKVKDSEIIGDKRGVVFVKLKDESFPEYATTFRVFKRLKSASS